MGSSVSRDDFKFMHVNRSRFCPDLSGPHEASRCCFELVSPDVAVADLRALIWQYLDTRHHMEIIIQYQPLFPRWKLRSRIANVRDWQMAAETLAQLMASGDANVKDMRENDTVVLAGLQDYVDLTLPAIMSVHISEGGSLVLY